MTVRVELIYDATCPNVAAARQQLREALARANRPLTWTEWDRAAPESPAYVRRYASPTILVAGVDVAEAPELQGTDGCAVGSPSANTILAALIKAE